MKERWPYHEARTLAERIMDDLAPFCERIIIAGSLRRKRPDVGDIEILYVPRFEDRQADMFATEPADVAHEEIGRWLAAEIITKRHSIDGKPTWGLKNKLAMHVDGGIPVDFFATTLENWWVSLVIRTGGKETNLKLTTGAQAKGAHLNAYGCGITLQNQQVIPATSERHVFELCNVPFQEPEHRL